ncbi:glycosyltransferase family 4 protein [Gammaproteobacteria bacterium]|jgi:polysaccharide biosynthesis protein PslH|nr:glycosyltransferase family 4 protein [Gammaproteobacteria bacterium]
MIKRPKKLLYISKDIFSSAKGGREQLSRLNFKILKEIYQEDLSWFDISPKKLNTTRSRFLGIFGYIDGLNEASCNQILNLLQTSDVQQVFLDGSNFGRLIKLIKIANPRLEIICYFHNVETKFFYDAFIKNITIKSFFVLIANFLAERLAVKFSDKLISLSVRDSSVLFSIFRKHASYISPLIVETFPAGLKESVIPQSTYHIFVGGAFYANINGLRWFIKNVMPNIEDSLYIIGKGFEKYRIEFEKCTNVYVLGYVEDIIPWYKGSKYAIAPIFEGSGMKTKIAESLMFGKIIIGSSEAFSGYEEVSNIAGAQCNSADEFIHAIKNYETSSNEHDRYEAYKAHYSYEAGKMRLTTILNK